jgi:hypothetical protein
MIEKIGYEYMVAGTYETKWYPTPRKAWAAYVKGSIRRGYPDPWHEIGAVNGDWSTAFEDGTRRVGGARDGHGNVTIEERRRDA